MYLYQKLQLMVVTALMFIISVCHCGLAQNLPDEIPVPKNVQVEYANSKVTVSWDDVVCNECVPSTDIKYVIILNKNPNDSDQTEGLSDPLTEEEYRSILNDYQLGHKWDEQAVVDSGFGQRIINSGTLYDYYTITIWAYYIDPGVSQASSNGVRITKRLSAEPRSKNWIWPVVGVGIGTVVVSYGIIRLKRRYRNRSDAAADGNNHAGNGGADSDAGSGEYDNASDAFYLTDSDSEDEIHIVIEDEEPHVVIDYDPNYDPNFIQTGFDEDGMAFPDPRERVLVEGRQSRQIEFTDQTGCE